MSGTVWRFQREALAARWRVITLDLQGHGLSPAGDGQTLTALADGVARLCTRLQLHDATLIGWSLGAQVALAAASILAERLAALVLVGGTPKFTSSPDYPHGLPTDEVRGMALRLRRNYVKTMGDFFRGMFSDNELSHDQYQRIVHEIVLGGRLPDEGIARQTLDILLQADLRPRLAGINLPVLLIHGTEDTICPAAASAYMAEKLPNAALRLMEGTGHAPFLSRPAAFNLLLQDFLRSIHDRD
jgi:pimeloyl-[acyl-carrier protein] methyl ester esterase